MTAAAAAAPAVTSSPIPVATTRNRRGIPWFGRLRILWRHYRPSAFHPVDSCHSWPVFGRRAEQRVCPLQFMGSPDINCDDDVHDDGVSTVSQWLASALSPRYWLRRWPRLISWLGVWMPGWLDSLCIAVAVCVLQLIYRHLLLTGGSMLMAIMTSVMELYWPTSNNVSWWSYSASSSSSWLCSPPPIWWLLCSWFSVRWLRDPFAPNDVDTTSTNDVDEDDYFLDALLSRGHEAEEQDDNTVTKYPSLTDRRILFGMTGLMMMGWFMSWLDVGMMGLVMQVYYGVVVDWFRWCADVVSVLFLWQQATVNLRRVAVDLAKVSAAALRQHDKNQGAIGSVDQKASGVSWSSVKRVVYSAIGSEWMGMLGAFVYANRVQMFHEAWPLSSIWDVGVFGAISASHDGGSTANGSNVLLTGQAIAQPHIQHLFTFTFASYLTSLFLIYMGHRVLQLLMGAFDCVALVFGYEFPEAPAVLITDVQMDSFAVRWSCRVPVRFSRFVGAVRSVVSLFGAASSNFKQTKHPDDVVDGKTVPASVFDRIDVDEYQLELDGCMVGATRETAAVISDLQPGRSYRLRVFALFGRNWTPSVPIYIRTLHFSAGNQRRRSLTGSMGVSALADASKSQTDGAVLTMGGGAGSHHGHREWHKKLVDEKELDSLQADFNLSSQQRAEVQALVDAAQAEFQQKMDELNGELGKLRTSTESVDVLSLRQKQRKDLKQLEDQRRELDQSRTRLQSELDKNQQILADLNQDLQEKRDDIEFCKNERNRIMQQLIDDETHFESCQSQLKSDIERLEKFHADNKIVLENKRKETSALAKEVEAKLAEMAKIREQNAALESAVVKHRSESEVRLDRVKNMTNEKAKIQSEITALKYKLEEQRRAKARMMLGMQSAIPSASRIPYPTSSVHTVAAASLSNAIQSHNFIPTGARAEKSLSSKQILMEDPDESFEDILGAAHKLLESEFDDEEDKTASARPPQVFFGNNPNAYRPASNSFSAPNNATAFYPEYNTNSGIQQLSTSFNAAAEFDPYADYGEYDYSAAMAPTAMTSTYAPNAAAYGDNGMNASMNVGNSNQWNYWPSADDAQSMQQYMDYNSYSAPSTGLPATLPLTNKMLSQHPRGGNKYTPRGGGGMSSASQAGGVLNQNENRQRRPPKKNRQSDEHTPVAMWLDNKSLQQ